MAVGSAASVIFGPMLNFFTFCYSTWRNDKEKKFEQRRKVYKEEFLPAYEKLAEIHKDYMDSFHEFYELSKAFQTPPYELVRKFRGYGRGYQAWREDVRCFVEVAAVFSKNLRFEAEKIAVSQFGEAVKDYFEATSPDGSKWTQSWFSSFLNEFEEHARQGRSPWEETYEGMGYTEPKQSLMSYLRVVYETELPNRWARVAKAKAALQTAFVNLP